MSSKSCAFRERRGCYCITLPLSRVIASIGVEGPQQARVDRRGQVKLAHNQIRVDILHLHFHQWVEGPPQV